MKKQKDVHLCIGDDFLCSLEIELLFRKIHPFQKIAVLDHERAEFLQKAFVLWHSDVLPVREERDPGNESGYMPLSWSKGETVPRAMNTRPATSFEVPLQYPNGFYPRKSGGCKMRHEEGWAA